MIQLKVYNSPAKLQQFWIDLYETEPIKLTLSIEDITNADATSTYSKTFKVPGTRQNAEFFKNSFDVDGTLFDVTIKKPAEILVDGAEFKQGQVRLQRVYLNTELDRYDYELIFLGETRDFSSKIGEKGLCELQLPDLIGGNVAGSSLQPSDIVLSWQAYPEGLSLASGLHNGNIIFPLIDHGNTYDDAGLVEQTRIAVDGPKRFTQAANAVTLDRFKPMIRAKRIWDKIFEDAGYTYTSSFITSDLFHQIYVSAFGNTATVGWDSTVSSPTSDNIAHCQNNAPANYSGSNDGPIFLPEAVNDPGGNLTNALFNYPGSSYNTTSYTYYTVPAAGEYQIAGQCFYSGSNENSDYTPTYVYATLSLVSFPAGGGAPTTIAESFSGHNELLQFNVTVTTGVTPGFNVGDQLVLVLGDIIGQYQIDNLYTANFALDVIKAPGEFNPVSSLECTYKQIDFVKDMLIAFRLVLSPDPNNVQNFIVEPWQTYINSGELYDWSDKLVEDKDFVIEPVFYSQMAEIDFKFQPGGDYANIYHQQAYSEPYGWLQFNANNDLLIGKREIKLTGIAPTILTNLEGTAPVDNFNIPQLHTHSQEDGVLQHLPIKPKTRFMFYDGLQPISVSSQRWHFNGTDGGAGGGAWAVYPLVSPYQTWPIQPQTLNLNWANDVQYWGTATGLNNNGSTLYDNYWSRYLSFLYGKYSRRVTAYFVLNNVDLNTFSFDDTIFVNGTYYRPEKIIDVEIGAYTQVKVQLLTANDYRPAVIPFQTLLECTAVGVGGLCEGYAGSINVTTNGTPGFTWSLSNGQSGAALNGGVPGLAPYTFTIPNVSAGTYTLNIIDSLGRTKELSITVPVSTATPVIGAFTKTNASDCNTCDGTITAACNIPGATFEWADGPTGNTRNGLCAGNYYFTAIAPNGCMSPSYIVEISCEAAEGDIWKFYRSSADCTQMFNESKNVFYPTGTTPPNINHFYDLSTLAGGTIKGCWTPTNITLDTQDALVIQEYNTCQECNNIATERWRVVNCVTGSMRVVVGQPGIAAGQSWKLFDLKGCWEVLGITFELETAVLETGPYSTCEECLGIAPITNYRIEDCDGGGSYNAPKGSCLFIVGDVVQYIRDTAPTIVYCGTITDTEFPTGLEDATLYSCVSYDCDDTIHCNFIITPPTPTPGPTPTPTPLPTDLCVSNYGASMAPCVGGSADDYMEGYIDLSGVTPVDAYFTIKVNYIPGSPTANCANLQSEIDLTVTVYAGESQGLLTCPQAPFIDFNGATICSTQVIDGPYPLCEIPPLDCIEYTIGGYDIGCTTYLDCDGISQEACYNGPSASGFDATSFCATSIVSYYGSQPFANGNTCL